MKIVTVAILAATLKELPLTPLDGDLSGWPARMATVTIFTLAHPCYQFTQQFSLVNYNLTDNNYDKPILKTRPKAGRFQFQA